MRTLTLTVGLWLAAIGFAQKPGDPNPEPPEDKPAGPLVGVLKAKKTNFLLDRQGMTPAQYLKAVQDGSISAPEVDLVLEIRNTSKEELKLRVSGATPRLQLTLKGKGKIVTTTTKRTTDKLQYVTLKPNEAYEFPIKRLAGNPTSSTQETQYFWTEPGEYTLEATLTLSSMAIAPAAVPPNNAAVRPAVVVNRTVSHTITTKPVPLTVKLKE